MNSLERLIAYIEKSFLKTLYSFKAHTDVDRALTDDKHFYVS